MDEEEKVVRLLASVRELESSLKKLAESAKEKSADVHSFAKVLREIENLPAIDPESLRPVAHWEEIPGSYKDHIGKDGSWFVPATRCTNPECREINPCSLKTPFCPMCGARMEDVPYDY